MDLIKRLPNEFTRDTNNSDKFFYGALGVSLVIHLLVIGYFSWEKVKVFRKPLKQIEVTYQSIAVKKIEQPREAAKAVKAVKEQGDAKKIKVLEKSSQELPVFDKSGKDIEKLSDHLKFSQKESPKIGTLDMQRNISIPVLKSEKITNPKYLSYNQSIRQKIKMQAYRYVDNPEFQEGEVYLTFVLAQNGTLQDLKIINEKTHASEYLKSTGIRSIKEANPFPPFPADLNYPELTFNVVISFEVNE